MTLRVVSCSCWHWPAPEPLLRGPRISNPVTTFRPQQRTTWLAPQAAHPKGSLERHQSPLGWALLCGIAPAQYLVHCGCDQYSQPVNLKVNPTHWQVNSNKSSTATSVQTTSTRATLMYPEQVIMETVPRSPTGHVLHKATLPKMGDIANLPTI